MELIVKIHSKDTLEANQVESAIVLIENAVDEKLSYTIGDIAPTPIKSRLQLLSAVEATDVFEKKIPWISNAIESKMITFSGHFLPHGVNNSLPNLWYILLVIKKKMLQSNQHTLFSYLTLVINSYWGTLSFGNAESKFARQRRPNYHPISVNDLPILPHISVFDSPYIPGNLGWLNYWPAPTLKRINFQEHHRALFHSVQPAANDGLILQITEQPLDFDIAEHLRKTVAIYDALPAIGGRDCV